MTIYSDSFLHYTTDTLRKEKALLGESVTEKYSENASPFDQFLWLQILLQIYFYVLAAEFLRHQVKESVIK